MKKKNALTENSYRTVTSYKKKNSESVFHPHKPRDDGGKLGDCLGLLGFALWLQGGAVALSQVKTTSLLLLYKTVFSVSNFRTRVRDNTCVLYIWITL